MQNKITAKDFFLNLGVIVAFYASIIALVTLLFEIINFTYPKITNAYYYYSPSIGFQVATLIVAFPIFITLSWLLRQSYEADPQLREGWVRRWLSYITLFVAGAVVAGDLITVIYMYLDGQELTSGFLLKVLVLLVVASGVFLYYLRDIRNFIDKKERAIWRFVSLGLVLISIVLGFVVIGSPADQRAYRLDNQRISDLQGIQWQIVNYWQQKGVMPENFEDFNDSLKNTNLPVDPETGEDYTYNRKSNLSFDLCAEFRRDSAHMTPISYSMMGPRYEAYDMMMLEGENWQHPAGMHCFERSIDPELYPVRSR